MKLRILIIIPLVIALFSCTLGTTSTTTQNNIPKDIQEEINRLDNKLIQAIAINDIDNLRLMVSDAFLKNSGNQLNQQIAQLSELIKTTEYQIVNQFYTQNSTIGKTNTAISGTTGVDDYVIQYKAINEEVFTSLVTPDVGRDKLLFLNIYGKYPEGWKLNTLQIGQYTLNKKTAPQLYQQAMQEYEKGFLTDAANTIFLCSKVAYPVNEFFKYKKESEMNEFSKKVLKELNEKFTFPITLSEIESKPQIFSIYPFGTEEGYFPAVDYLTKIDLADTIQTRAENNKIHEIIGKKFKGLNKGKKYTLYKAYNEIPDGTKGVENYGFTKKNK